MVPDPEILNADPEAFLALEMEEQIGYPKHAPEGRGSSNSRNGFTPKTVRDDFGEVDLDTPRDRNGEFEPKIVAKRQTNAPTRSQMLRLCPFCNNLATSPSLGVPIRKGRI